MDNPAVAELNRAVAARPAHLQVKFWAEGTYQVRADTLLAQRPGTESGPFSNDQHVVQLTRRRLVVEFLVGNDLPEMVEKIEY